MNNFKMNIDDLPESGIDYEILIRGATPLGDLAKKKQLLRSIVRNEDPSITFTSCFDPETDIKACFSEFTNLKGKLPRDGTKLNKFEASKLCSMAIHLRERLKRVKFSNENQKSRVKGVLQATGQIFNAITGMTSAEENTQSPELSDEEPNQTVRPNMATENLNEDDSLIRTSSPTECPEVRSNQPTTGTIPKRPLVSHNTIFSEIFKTKTSQTNPYATGSNPLFGYSHDKTPASQPNNQETNTNLDIFDKLTQQNVTNQPSKHNTMFQFQPKMPTKHPLAHPKFQLGLWEAAKQTHEPRPSVTFLSQNNQNEKSSYFENSKFGSLEWDPNDIQNEFQSNFAKNFPNENKSQDTLNVTDKTTNDATKGHEESLLVKYRNQLDIALDIINKFSAMTGNICSSSHPSLQRRMVHQSCENFFQTNKHPNQIQKQTNQDPMDVNSRIQNHKGTSPIFLASPVPPFNPTTNEEGTEERPSNLEQFNSVYPHVNLPRLGYIDTKDRRLPVNKWGFKFTGDNTGLHVLDFINTIDMYMNLEKTSKAEVLNSAYYLFDGPARVWYRTWYQSFHSFDSLIARLKMTYLPADHDMILRREIENREQAQKESFAQFLTDIESKCQKLIKPLQDDEKLFIIRRNLNTFYSTSIAAHQVQSIDHLIELCRLVDTYGRTARNQTPLQNQNFPNSTRQFSNNQKRTFNTNFRVNEVEDTEETTEQKQEEETVNTLRTVTQPQRRRTIACQTDSTITSNSYPTLQHQQPNTTQTLPSYMFIPSFNPGFIPFPPPSTSIPVKKSNIGQTTLQQLNLNDKQQPNSTNCWNCHVPGHSYRNCPQPQMRIFCFRCGNPDVYSPNCACASGNAQ
jgi:hypothetical protein